MGVRVAATKQTSSVVIPKKRLNTSRICNANTLDLCIAYHQQIERHFSDRTEGRLRYRYVAIDARSQAPENVANDGTHGQRGAPSDDGVLVSERFVFRSQRMR